MRIDDVRDMFGADASLSERLRAIVAERLGAEQSGKRHWFRPMLRRDPDTEVRTDRPMRVDVDAMLAGGYIEPERMAVSWQILTAWLQGLAAAQVVVPWDPAMFERVEWDLARAGLNSDYSLRRLADRQLGLPLRPANGQVAGYAKAVHVVETVVALRAAMSDPAIAAETSAFVAPIQGVLDVAVDRGLDVVVLGAG